MFIIWGSHGGEWWYILSESSLESALTPVMKQYFALKRDYSDCILFYRMGDFYEMFFDDAIQAAAVLSIVLTQRGRYQGKDIPMCGVPVRNYTPHLVRLVRHGFRVAICEQIEDVSAARKRGPKAVVERAVVRVVTAGTIIEDEWLDSRDHNYLTALTENQGIFGLAWVDISTGDFQVQAPTLADLGAALARLAPGELLVSEHLCQRADLDALLAEWKAVLNPQPASRFNVANAYRHLETLYNVKTLDGFGAFEPVEIAAAGALINYIELTQNGHLPRLQPLRQLRTEAVMIIDSATCRNLTSIRSKSGSERSSLRAIIDRTMTSSGSRVLANNLYAPLTDPVMINERLDAVQFFKDDSEVRILIRESLRRCPDIERALSRLTIGRGEPHDLVILREALARGPGLHIAVAESTIPAPPILLTAIRTLLQHTELVDHLMRALLAVHSKDGDCIASAYDSTLDALRAVRDDSGQVMATLQNRYATAADMTALKVHYSGVLGFYIEVSTRQAEKLEADPGTFIRRQTMAHTVRFTTSELAALETKRYTAIARIQVLERKIFQDLVNMVVQQAEDIAATARAIAVLDVYSALGAFAAECNCCRPLVDDTTAFEIQGGRHPVIEAIHEGPFVANDCRLDGAQRLWLLTGPNMAGKSTFLRQNALLALLAQAGSFVPAESAHIGVIDRLFSRVGAADDLARGRSTFMVEMVETATILNQATSRSLVILDEIGRGTATFDGVSIAWASIEHLHNVVRCRGLLATHYHELATLASKLPSLACYTMRVKEWSGQVVFLHEVITGTADRSYGLDVARLAGFPKSVLARAEEVLLFLEKSGQRVAPPHLEAISPADSADSRLRASATGLSYVERFLKEINLDDLTPRQAIELLYSLKESVRKSES
ncbi:DNA mismatch repair protein MutS [invertebrate metagenome]|uniref:DNA mismatch repair protein MutS n=1 Tax=invertebrate metagenome TaxID=1711999 RepID=A0A484H7U9_9ZZZZ